MQTKEDFAKLKAVLIYNIEEVWGPRCDTKDTDDFPELHDDNSMPLFPVGDPDSGRCPVCLVYEKFDAFWRKFEPNDLEVS